MSDMTLAEAAEQYRLAVEREWAAQRRAEQAETAAREAHEAWLRSQTEGSKTAKGLLDAGRW